MKKQNTKKTNKLQVEKNMLNMITFNLFVINIHLYGLLQT